MIRRRQFITGLISLMAAPAIVRAENLMPIRASVSTGPKERVWQAWELEHDGFGFWRPLWGGGRLVEGVQGRISVSIRNGEIAEQSCRAVRSLSWTDGRTFNFVPAGILDDAAPDSYCRADGSFR